MRKQSTHEHHNCVVPPQPRRISFGVRNPGKHDVLVGQGSVTNKHAGNIKFRLSVENHYMSHKYAMKKEKKAVAQSIVTLVRSTGGRFLVKDKSCNLWFEVGDKHALEKAKFTLRKKYAEARVETSNLIIKKKTRVERQYIDTTKIDFLMRDKETKYTSAAQKLAFNDEMFYTFQGDDSRDSTQQYMRNLRMYKESYLDLSAFLNELFG